MKNFMKMFIIITLIAVLGCLMVACEDGLGRRNKNQFVGTWTGYDWQYEYMQLVCTDSHWTMSWPSGYYYDNTGTYTYDGNSATIYEDGYGMIGTATVSKNTLNLNVYGYNLVLTK